LDHVKPNEDHLISADKLFSCAFDNSHIGLSTLSPNGSFQLVNDKFCDIVGYQREELLKMTFVDITHPDEKEWSKQVVMEMLERKCDSVRLEKRYIHKSGSIIWGILTATLHRDDKGNPWFFFVQLYEISDIKKTEEELILREELYRNTFDNAPIGIALVSHEGKLLEANQSLCNMLQYSHEKLVALRMIDIAHPDDQRFIIEHFQQLFSGSIKCHRTEKRFVKKDGSLIWVILQTTIQRDHNNKSIHAIVQVVDITKEKENETRIVNISKERQALALQLVSIQEEERKKIARDIHDELGQYLTTLTFEIKRIQNKVTPNNSVIRKNLDGLMMLVDQTIKTAKRVTYNLRPPIIDDLGLQDAIEWYVNDFRKRTKINCELTIGLIPSVLPPEITTAVFRILQEGLTNVVKHSSATVVIITLNKDDGNLVLEIDDNGVGISTKQQKQVPTFGLIGIRERVLSLGGTTRINSPGMGQGTKISVSIPLESV